MSVQSNIFWSLGVFGIIIAYYIKLDIVCGSMRFGIVWESV